MVESLSLWGAEGKGVGIRIVTQFTEGAARHILCLGDTDRYQTVAKHYSICNDNGEDGHDAVWKLCKPAVHPYEALSWYERLSIISLLATSNR